MSMIYTFKDKIIKLKVKLFLYNFALESLRGFILTLKKHVINQKLYL